MLSLVKTYHVARNFLLNLLNKEFLVFLFFLTLSGIFWLMMTLNDTYEKEIPLGVRLTGIPKNVVMTTEISDTVYVTVRDKGYVLLSYITSNKLRPLSYRFADYADRQTGKGQISISDIQKSVRRQLSASTVITAIKAERLGFYYNYGLHKKVEIKPVGNIVPHKNFYLSHVQFEPEKVVVYAGKEKLDSVRSVTTEYLNIINFDDTVVRMVRLKPIEGMKIVPATVKLTLYPDILTEESVEVPVMAINKPDGLIVRTFPQRVRVRFTVGASMFRTIKESDFRVVVDYREIAARPSDKCNLYLQAKPRGVNNAHLEMKQIDYLIEQ